MKRSVAPFSAARICQGTRFEWCSISVRRITSPLPTFFRPHAFETRFTDSVVPRVKTISFGERAFRTRATLPRTSS